MATRNFLKGLGIFVDNQRIYLYYNLLNSSSTTFNLSTSSDGLSFEPSSVNPSIVDQQGIHENIAQCSDFRISKNGGRYFLVYKTRRGKKRNLCVAESFNLITWKKIGEILKIKEIGMIVPDFKFDNKFVMFFGEKVIKTALSDDLLNWKIVSNSVIGNFSSCEVGNLVVNEDGILLIYYVKHGSYRRAAHCLETVLFDKDDLLKITNGPDTLWEQTEEWENKKIDKVGVLVFGGKIISYWTIGRGNAFTIVSCPFGAFSGESKFPSVFLKKFRDNPILAPIIGHFWESKATFNPAAIYELGKVHLIYRAVGDDDVSVLGYASTADGTHIDERLEEPVYLPSEPFECVNGLPSGYNPYFLSGGYGGCEDPRITRIDDRFYMTYVAFDGINPPRVALTSIQVDDFLSHRWDWERPVLISPPGVVDKNAVILPEKINGKYVIFHRIFPNILVDFVDKLDFRSERWLSGEFVIRPDPKSWDSRKIGAGPPPIKTKEGWLLIYHAVGENDPGRYKIGAMLLDLSDPTKVLYRSKKPIIEPTKSYENEGFKHGVVYPCGAVAIKNKLFVYYGGADMVVCAAYAAMDQFLSKLKHHQTITLQTVVLT